AVLAALADAMARGLALWRRGENFAAIRAAWLERAAGLGGRITVNMPGRAPLEGTFRGLDVAGRLLLASGADQIAIDAGDVFLPGLAAGAKEA
ncbi:MAG: biotin--[acetyl-CoA-carboxylase] ligase, partial [Beijerinckiaceae bacterium]|nr:biotin--[acetyl-CoA-carboxylase] ligase [Beijerinckiaceae bacterium]